MALKDLKARLKTVLEGVSGVKNVHDHAVYAKDAEQEKALLIGDAGRLHCWTVSRESAAQPDQVINESLQAKTTQILVQGFYAVAEADKSEEAFEALVDAVIQALNNDRKPANAGGTKLAATVADAAAPALRLQDFRQFGPSGTLCHHCEIVLAVTEDVT